MNGARAIHEHKWFIWSLIVQLNMIMAALEYMLISLPLDTHIVSVGSKQNTTPNANYIIL